MCLDGVVVRDDGSHDHVRVAVDILGAGVDDDVCPEGQRPLEVGAHEGVVHHHEDFRVVFLGSLADSSDVNDLQQRIGG